jgi:hypothetical protein
MPVTKAKNNLKIVSNEVSQTSILFDSDPNSTMHRKTPQNNRGPEASEQLYTHVRNAILYSRQSRPASKKQLERDSWPSGPVDLLSKEKNSPNPYNGSEDT